ncbi:MAG: KamA family radical SAM protein [Planctomycetota bacterium]
MTTPTWVGFAFQAPGSTPPEAALTDSTPTSNASNTGSQSQGARDKSFKLSLLQSNEPPIRRTERADKARVKYIRKVSQIENIPEDQREILERVSQRYVFRANDYYLGLIDWNDPSDPIRQLIVPREEELKDWGELDASNEAANTVTPGVQHKYKDTCLLLCNEVCGAYCRYCFRKRLFMDDNEEVTKDVSEGVAYIRKHPEITDVLLTGGDPLIMSTRRLREIIAELRKIPHVRTIRIGSKMPAFNPYRILDDEDLQEMFWRYSRPDGRIYLMCHFDHPREFTPPAIDGIRQLLRLGVMCVNQCPLVKGVNDDAETLRALFETCTDVGCPQYYLFQGRPTAGNEPYETPIVRGWQLFSEAKRRASGLSRRARFSMSHASGKVEICGVDDAHIYLRYHRAKKEADENRFLVAKRDDEAYWLDQLEIVN